MFIYTIVFILLALIVSHYYFTYLFFSKHDDSEKNNSLWLKLSLFSSLSPVSILVMFSYVYLQGGSSVAQFTQSHQLWSVWLNAYPILLFSMLPLSLVALTAFIIGVFKNREASAVCAQLLILLAYPLCYFILINTMPDA